ncbi:MAG: LssY C-terminal domain-containing protein [Patescibacteria group bacterium]|nr:LssY C-terminal domain-containing protein [Patescibacteria group bacterium]
MFSDGLRYVKRIAILIPGLIISYLSIDTVFPYFQRRVPVAVAVLITYVLTAYILIPAAIRLIRIIWPPRHLPLYCVTPDGFASDPLNVGVLATKKELSRAMKAAGWHVADSHKSIRNVLRHGFSTLFDWSYPNAPVSSLYLFGRHQDIAFQKPVSEAGTTNRHHVRFWATTFDDADNLTVRSIHWHHRAVHVRDDKLLWVGAASLDNGLAPIRHNLQVTHMIHPDTNRERELIVSQLQATQLVKEVSAIQLRSPYKLVNRAFRGHLHTDGKMSIVYLNPKS